MQNEMLGEDIEGMQESSNAAWRQHTAIHRRAAALQTAGEPYP